MKTYQFAVKAFDQTTFWELPEDSTLKGCLKYMLGLFRIGEATYCCSLTPSSYVIDLENLFLNPDGSYFSEEQEREMDREGYSHEGLDHGYYGYIDPDRVADNPLIGDILEIEVDPEEYADKEEMDRAAWDAALEEVSANSASYEPSFTGVLPELA